MPQEKPPQHEDPQALGQLTLDALADAKRLVELLIARKHILTTVESCTGGLFAGLITSVPGASDVLMDAFVTYSNEAKIALGVPRSVIDTYSVYSPETAVAMAQTGLTRSTGATIGLGITGSLSRVDPANSEASKPGEVYIGIVSSDRIVSKTLHAPEPHRYTAKLHITLSTIEALLEIL